ncbi:hypothetical protein H2201_007104 [Coniosporium apollinis]|uniref:Uncharacterized protein n=1 Tax=Coniosporium apollinis TaxID=61459 RepID=A0ABQ9NKN6_9PEZI|nr:hypothetical protein H2201_007104 [Coniosporium apollinis]
MQRLTLRVTVSADGAWYRPKAPRRHQENLRGLRAYYEGIWADKDLAIRFIDPKDKQLRLHPLTFAMARYVLPIFLPLQRQRPIDVQNLSPEVTYWFQSRILQSKALKISPTVSAALQTARALFSQIFHFRDTMDFVKRLFPHDPNQVITGRPEDAETFWSRSKDFTCKAGLNPLEEILADAEARVMVVVERPGFNTVLLGHRGPRAAMHRYLEYLKTCGIRLGEQGM